MPASMISGSLIYRKTAKGQEEIAERKTRLPQLLRNLLIMVDGKKPAASIVTSLNALGDVTDSLSKLLDDGYIEPIQGGDPSAGSTTTQRARGHSVALAPITMGGIGLPEARRRVSRLAYATLGPGSEQLMERIERARSFEVLIAEASRCRDAIEFTRGRLSAEKFWEGVEAIRLK